MSAPKLVEPRLDTPTPRTSSGLGTRGLPDAVLSEHVRRLAVCAAVGAGLWAYGLVMDSMIRPLSVGTAVSYSSIVVEILAIIVSVIMFVYARYAPHTADRKADAGLFYFVLNAVGVAVINTQTGLADLIGGRGLSWNTKSPEPWLERRGRERQVSCKWRHGFGNTNIADPWWKGRKGDVLCWAAMASRAMPRK